jgi:hypothetical protein
MPRAPAGSSVGLSATEDRLRAAVRDDKAALLRPQLEQRGSILRVGLRDLDLRHVGFGISGLSPKGPRPCGFPVGGFLCIALRTRTIVDLDLKAASAGSPY